LLPVELNADFTRNFKGIVFVNLAIEEYPWLNTLQQESKDTDVSANQDKFIQTIQHTIWNSSIPPPNWIQRLVRKTKFFTHHFYKHSLYIAHFFCAKKAAMQ